MIAKQTQSKIRLFSHIIFYLFQYAYWRLTARIYKQSGFIRHKQAEIYYLIYGVGEPVVLLHGGLSNRISWFSQIPFLVNAGRQVIIIDTRGHGRSTLGNETLTYNLFAEDLVKVLDEINIQSSDILGWSDGGITALILGRFFPDRVKRIIAISANISPEGLTKKAQNQAQEKVNTFIFWMQSKWTGSGKYFSQLNQFIRQIWSSPILKKTDLSLIKASTLFIVGENDVVTVEHSKEMASILQNSQLIIVKKGGHATPITQAAQINHYIYRFLEQS
jgi:pimeloyl-ACP methyl ester carboxylesterase